MTQSLPDPKVPFLGGFSSSGSNVKMKIETQPKAMKSQGGPVLDVCWKDDRNRFRLSSATTSGET